MNAFCADQPEFRGENEFQGLEVSFNNIVEEIRKDDNLAEKIITMLCANEKEKIPFGFDKMPTKDNLMTFSKGLISISNLVNHMTFNQLAQELNKDLLGWFKSILDSKEGRQAI